MIKLPALSVICFLVLTFGVLCQADSSTKDENYVVVEVEEGLGVNRTLQYMPKFKHKETVLIKNQSELERLKLEYAARNAAREQAREEAQQVAEEAIRETRRDLR